MGVKEQTKSKLNDIKYNTGELVMDNAGTILYCLIKGRPIYSILLIYEEEQIGYERFYKGFIP